MELLQNLRDVFIKGAFNDKNNAGEECYNYMTNNFRMTISFFMFPIHLYIIAKILLSLNEKIKPKVIRKPSILEKIFGYASIFCLIFQMVLKAQSNQLIFTLNPCHVTLLVQIISLLSTNTLRIRVLAIIGNNLLFSPVFAVLVPQTSSYESSLEYYFYYIEHYIAIINPFVLIISERFYEDFLHDTECNLLSSFLFMIYSRLILTLVSIISIVNVNFALCPPTGNLFLKSADPFANYFGKWYYLLSESYIHLMALITGKSSYYIVRFINSSVRKFKIKKV